MQYGASLIANDSVLLQIEPTGRMLSDHGLDASVGSYQSVIRSLVAATPAYA